LPPERLSSDIKFSYSVGAEKSFLRSFRDSSYLGLIWTFKFPV
jgi:hypothetical protein